MDPLRAANIPTYTLYYSVLPTLSCAHTSFIFHDLYGTQYSRFVTFDLYFFLQDFIKGKILIFYLKKGKYIKFTEIDDVN